MAKNISNIRKEIIETWLLRKVSPPNGDKLKDLEEEVSDLSPANRKRLLDLLAVIQASTKYTFPGALSTEEAAFVTGTEKYFQLLAKNKLIKFKPVRVLIQTRCNRGEPLQQEEAVCPIEVEFALPPKVAAALMELAFFLDGFPPGRGKGRPSNPWRDLYIGALHRTVCECFKFTGRRKGSLEKDKTVALLTLIQIPKIDFEGLKSILRKGEIPQFEVDILKSGLPQKRSMINR